MFWEVKKIQFSFWNIVASALKTWIKWSWKIFFLILGKKISNLNWIYLHKIFITMYSIPYTRVHINIKYNLLISNNVWVKKTETIHSIVISHSSKSIWVIELSFCQNDSPTGGSFWQKDSLITHILFELWLITILWIVSVFLTQTLCSWEGFIFESKIFLHQYMSTLPLSSLCEFLT